MKDEANDLITAIGAVAELCRELYRQLVKNGFTEYQALELTKTYLVTTMTGSKGKDD